MLKNVYNLQSGKIESEEIIEKQKTRYIVKGFNNKGVSNFEQSKILTYNDVIYYDIETVNLGVDYTLLSKSLTLDLNNNIIKSFSLLIPKNRKFKKNIENLKKILVNNFIDERKKEVFSFEEKEEYFLLFYANDFNPISTLSFLVECFYYLSNVSHEKIENDRKKSDLKIIGFNNNKFDDLIFKHYPDANLYRDNRAKTNKIKLNLLKHDLTLTSFDSRDLSKNIGLGTLAKVGELVKLEKMEIVNSKNLTFNEIVNQNIRYNNNDNEIVYRFIKFVNLDLNIYQTNIASYTRKFFYKKLFNILKTDKIEIDKKINRFNLFGGRTEAYKHLTTNTDNIIKYLDFNSLYSSSRVVLDMVIGEEKIEKYENKEIKNYKYSLNQVVVNTDFKGLILKMENHFLTSKAITYKTINNEYSSKNFYIGKFKILGINPLFMEKAEMIEHYFPFISKILGKSSFSFDDKAIYQIGFYEICFLALFEFEILELYSIGKGKDPLKEEIIEIYENRNVLKSQKSPLEKLEKLKLNSGFGIFATNNIETQLILDNRQINTLNNISNSFKNTEKKEVWNSLKENNFIFKNGRDYFDIKNIGDYYYSMKEKSGQKWSGNSIPILGLNIVSNARFMMYSIFLDYILNSKDNIKNSKIYYTDTDSLFCHINIFKRLKSLNLIGNELGQLKDELPNEEILRVECFAPKSYVYTYKKEDGEIIKIPIFKGTGKEIQREIINQSLKTNINKKSNIFSIREALNPNTIQKRTLENGIFINKFGKSEELIEKWEEYKKKEQ